MCRLQALEQEVDLLHKDRGDAAQDLQRQLEEVQQALVGMAQVLHVPLADSSSTRCALPPLKCACQNL